MSKKVKNTFSVLDKDAATVLVSNEVESTMKLIAIIGTKAQAFAEFDSTGQQEYTCTITNIGLVALNLHKFFDVLQEGTKYVDGSFTVDGIAPVVPAVYDAVTRELSWAIPTWAPGVTHIIKFQTTGDITP